MANARLIPTVPATEGEIVGPDDPIVGPVERTAYAIGNYLQDISPLLTEGVLRVILAKRGLAASTPIAALEERDIDLAEAEVYYHLSNLPVGGATTKEVDGSWSTTSGGWTVSGANLAEWYRKYAALREKWGEKVITKSKIRVINL